MFKINPAKIIREKFMFLEERGFSVEDSFHLSELQLVYSNHIYKVEILHIDTGGLFKSKIGVDVVISTKNYLEDISSYKVYTKRNGKYVLESLQELKPSSKSTSNPVEFRENLFKCSQLFDVKKLDSLQVNFQNSLDKKEIWIEQLDIYAKFIRENIANLK